MTQKKSPTACDGRASEANPKNFRAQNTDFASHSQTDVVEAANVVLECSCCDRWLVMSEWPDGAATLAPPSKVLADDGDET